MIRRWGRPWYYFGLGGTIVSDYPVGYDTGMTPVRNPITNGRALPSKLNEYHQSSFEIAFIIITAIRISKERSKRAPEIKQDVQ